MGLDFFQPQNNQKFSDFSEPAAQNNLDDDLNDRQHPEQIGVNEDDLSRLQKLLDQNSVAFDKDIEYWKRLKVFILTNGSAKQTADIPDMRPWYLKFQDFLKELAGFEFPGYYIRHLLAENQRTIDDLVHQLDEVTKKLADNQQSPREIHHLKAQACDLNLKILHTFKTMVNQINREIDYALRFFKVFESIATTVIQFAISQKVPIPMPNLDFGLSAHFRMNLYNMVYPGISETTDRLMVNANGAMGRSKMAIIKNTADQHRHESIDSASAKTSIKRVYSEARLFSQSRRPVEPIPEFHRSRSVPTLNEG